MKSYKIFLEITFDVCVCMKVYCWMVYKYVYRC